MDSRLLLGVLEQARHLLDWEGEAIVPEGPEEALIDYMARHHATGNPLALALLYTFRHLYGNGRGADPSAGQPVCRRDRTIRRPLWPGSRDAGPRPGAHQYSRRARGLRALPPHRGASVRQPRARHADPFPPDRPAARARMLHAAGGGAGGVPRRRRPTGETRARRVPRRPLAGLAASRGHPSAPLDQLRQGLGLLLRHEVRQTPARFRLPARFHHSRGRRRLVLLRGGGPLRRGDARGQSSAVRRRFPRGGLGPGGMVHRDARRQHGPLHHVPLAPAERAAPELLPVQDQPRSAAPLPVSVGGLLLAPGGQERRRVPQVQRALRRLAPADPGAPRTPLPAGPGSRRTLERRGENALDADGRGRWPDTRRARSWASCRRA